MFKSGIFSEKNLFWQTFGIGDFHYND